MHLLLILAVASAWVTGHPAWAVLIVLLVPVVYVVECAWWPFGYCLCCKGAGKHHKTNSRVFKDCWWCGGSGRRLRVGRRVWNRLRSVQRKAN